MKERLFFFIVLVCLFSPLEAQDGFKGLADGKRLAFSYVFEAVSDRGSFSGNGEIVCQGPAFKLVSGDFTLYNDTRTLCTVAGSTREVVLDNGVETDLLSEPASVLEILGLPSQGAVSEFSYTSDGLPASLRIRLENGMAVSITFSDIRVSENGPLSDFVFSCDESQFVTDLRKAR